MKIIMFNNGEKIKVHDVIVDKLKEVVLSKDGANKFQFYTDSSTGKTELVLNVNDISAIYPQENII